MQKFFEPASVVLIGVSRQTGPGAYNNLEMLLSYGYAGRIYLVHPKVPEILGYKTYRQVAELPEVPDLAVISLGRERVLPAFAECAAHGIKRVVVISQGFADADDRGQGVAGATRGPGPGVRCPVFRAQHHGGAQPLCRLYHRLYRHSPGAGPCAPDHGGAKRGLSGGGLVLHRADGQGHRRGQRRRRRRGGRPGVPGA